MIPAKITPKHLQRTAYVSMACRSGDYGAM